MVRVILVEADGTRRSVEAREGEPLMHAARLAGIRGIVAECGGAAMCATCHCHGVEAPAGALPDPAQDEADTIESWPTTPGRAAA